MMKNRRTTILSANEFTVEQTYSTEPRTESETKNHKRTVYNGCQFYFFCASYVNES